MLTAAQLAGKFTIMPGRQTVTYYSATASGWGAGQTVGNVESRPLKRSETPVDGACVGKRTRMFHPWTSQLAGTEPKPGDKLTDAAGLTWHVLDVDLGLIDQRWSLACVAAK